CPRLPSPRTVALRRAGPVRLCPGARSTGESMRAGAGGSCTFQHAGHGERDAVPAVPMLFQLAPTRGGETVVLGSAIIFRGPPLRFQLAVLFQTIERREQRSGVDMELIVAENGQPL